ncbi:hypothetical protein [Tropicimonas sp. S265A]|uniref:hypothetical protein n=1 Tax=Tropicimonas sp. S265A TaxID=3415134 RepID=UPI003C7DE3C8
MPAPIEPTLFARVMSLPDGPREDLLEFLGGSPVDDLSLEKLIDNLAYQSEPAQHHCLKAS